MDFSLVTVSVDVPVELAPMVQGLVELFGVLDGLEDARGLELSVHEGLKDLDRQMMEVNIAHKARQYREQDIREVRCPHCGDGWATLLDEDLPRFATTIRGRVDYQRPVYRCTNLNCRRERSPFDEQLGLEGKEHLTPLVQKKMVWAGAMLSSFDKAQQDMAHQAELPVSAKEIQRTVEQVGTRALALQEEEVRERGRPAAWDQPLKVEERPETVVIEMDGTCVMGRDGEGHEVKCATAFGLDARATTGLPGKERSVLLHRCYCATSKGIRAFRGMVWAMAVWWGIRSAKRVVVIGDGIDWIWNFSADRFHFALPGGGVQRPIEILDFFHACENLSKARKLIYRDPESKRAQEWYDKWRGRLRAGGVNDLIVELEQRRRRANSQRQREELAVRRGYFEKHRQRMRYPEYESQGLPIGSGAIEGTCKNLIKGRMSCVGQRWGAEKGIEQMTALRVRIFNERWDDLWQHAELPQAA